MVCKEDVIIWFKEAASYRRIDVMCALLNMCIPFELRYLGTYIEEQGKHDYQELRGAALTANDAEKLAKEFASFKGLLDKCARHRLTVYISLLQSRNYHCANWIYNTLLRTDLHHDIFANNSGGLNKDVHTELVLLFTLALNHPAFNFEQKRYFGDVVTKFTEPEIQIQSTINPPPCPPGLGYAIKPPLPVHHIPMSCTKIPSHCEAPMPPPGIPLPAAGEFGSGGGSGGWSRTHFELAAPPPAFPPLPISPLVSQQSSPTASRSVSPSRMYSCRPTMQPSPLLPAHMQQQQQQQAQFNADLKTVPVDEINHADTPEKTPHQQWMESIIASKLPNGIITGIPISQLPPQPQPPKTIYLPSSTTSDLAALRLDSEHLLHHRCTSSSASSNSSDCQSPPDTPTELHGPGRGRPQKRAPPPAPPGLTALPPNADGGGGMYVVPQTLSQQSCTVPCSSHFPAAPSGVFNTRFYTQTYRPQFPPGAAAAAYQQNGELPYLFPPHYLPMATFMSTTVPPPKITCYNCGIMGHMGSDCKHQTIEEITQKKGYELDYTSPPPPDIPPAPPLPPPAHSDHQTSSATAANAASNHQQLQSQQQSQSHQSQQQ